MARFRSGGKVYEMAPLDEVTPRDLLTFPREASAAMGRPVKFSDIEQIGREVDALPDDEKEDHPDFAFLMTVMIWVSRRAAGDRISYDACLDEPFAMLEETEDHQGKSPARKGKKKAGPKGSVQAISAASESSEATTPPTSISRSVGA